VHAASEASGKQAELKRKKWRKKKKLLRQQLSEVLEALHRQQMDESLEDQPRDSISLPASPEPTPTHSE
jgi:frataxin-like iron-binding protein CyaY